MRNDNKKNMIIGKNGVICVIVTNIQFITVPVPLIQKKKKNPHNNTKHMVEQSRKLNIPVDEINNIELFIMIMKVIKFK